MEFASEASGLLQQCTDVHRTGGFTIEGLCWLLLSCSVQLYSALKWFPAIPDLEIGLKVIQYCQQQAPPEA